MNIHCFLVRWERSVEVCFADIGAGRVYGTQCGRAVETEAVGANTDDGAIFKVCLMIAEVAGAPVGMVCQVDIGNFGKRWSRVASQGVEC